MLKRYGWGLLSVGLAASCAGDEGHEQQELGVAESTLSSFRPANEALWPQRDIPVCWGPTTFQNSAWTNQRQLARNLIENSYGRVTDLRFLGWGRCEDNPTHVIRLNFSTSGSGSTSGYGTDPLVDMTVPVNATDFATRVLHEFAHALGFDHELDRDDVTAGACNLNGARLPMTEFTTNYDDLSVTNSTYCNGRGALSPWDVVALQNLYGRKPIGSLVGANNKCADIDNPGGQEPGSATRVQAWDCVGNSNQLWGYDPLHRFHAQAFDWGFLDVQWANTSNGTPVWNWTDNPGPAQTWQMQDVQIVGMGDLCLEISSWSTNAAVRLANCNPAEVRQRWTVIDSGRASGIYSLRARSPGGTNYCLSIPGTEQSAVITSCGSGSGQRAFALINRHLVNEANVCLDVQWGNPAAGNRVWGFWCNWDQHAAAQHWKIRGAIRGLASKCLDVDLNGGVRNGSSVQLWSCLAGNPANQTWEYHF